MDLHHPRFLGHDGRDERELERSGRDHNIGRLDHTVGGFGAKARSVGLVFHRHHLDAATDWCVDLLCVRFEVLHDSVLGSKAVGIDVRKAHVRKPVVPCRTVGNERVPAFAPPTLRDPVPLDNEVANTVFAQMLAHCQAGLATADDERVDDFN